jgi:thiamine kinase-like enzyme
MISSTMHTEQLVSDLEVRIGFDLVNAWLIRSGRNSQVYRIKTPRGHDFLLKLYPQQGAHHPRRLQVEWDALSWLNKKNLDGLPKPVKTDHQTYAVYSFIDGENLRNTAVSNADVQQALSLIQSLVRLSFCPEAKISFHLAADSFLNPQMFYADICRRYDQIKHVAIEDGEGELLVFLLEHVEPVMNWMKGLIEQLVPLDPDAALLNAERILSPSDFGFHNALRRQDGQLAFVDFEYFGWDDVVKTLWDFCLHPGMMLTDAQKRMFVDGLISCSSDPDKVRYRFDQTRPVFVLKWCLIMLNEFSRDGQMRRNHAGWTVDSESRKRQLMKSQRMFNTMFE